MHATFGWVFFRKADNYDILSCTFVSLSSFPALLNQWQQAVLLNPAEHKIIIPKYWCLITEILTNKINNCIQNKDVVGHCYDLHWSSSDIVIKLTP